MAKVRLKNPKPFISRRPSGYRKILITAEIRRSSDLLASGRSKAVIEACVRVAGYGAKTNMFCALGKNPRKALGAALKRAGGSISARYGAFAGIR